MSAGLQLIEPIIEALVARLTADLPAEIVVANADVSDTYTLEAPRSVLDFLPPPTFENQLPLVGVQDLGGRFEDDTGFTATGLYDIAVVVYLQDYDHQALVRKLRRYVRCLARVVLASRAVTPSWGLTLQRIDYGPTLADSIDAPQTYLSWASIVITARQDED